MHLCKLESIGDGDSLGFDPMGAGRDALFVVRRGQQVYGWLNRCPHQGYEGTKMAWRRNRYVSGDGQHIFCAAHGARFDIESGHCVSGPCLGKSLTAVTIQIDENKELCWIP